MTLFVSVEYCIRLINKLSVICMQFSWFEKKKVMLRRRRRRSPHHSQHAKHYTEHKETARTLVHARLAHWNQFYGHTYNRVAIRNQRSRWGSCSSKQNLNFNYKLIFLPIELVDYVIVHELCHLKHFNHSDAFWSAVAETITDYEIKKQHLRMISLTMNRYVQDGVHTSVQHVVSSGMVIPAV